MIRHHRTGRSSSASTAGLKAARSNTAWLIRCSCGARFVDELDGRAVAQHAGAGHAYTTRPNPQRPAALR